MIVNLGTAAAVGVLRPGVGGILACAPYGGRLIGEGFDYIYEGLGTLWVFVGRPAIGDLSLTRLV